MARKLLFIATEELEVDKLDRTTHRCRKNGEFDVLYEGIQEDIERAEEPHRPVKRLMGKNL